MNDSLFKRVHIPYKQKFDHIADICNLMRLSFSSDDSEEIIAAFNCLRSCEDITIEIKLPMVLIRKRFGLSGFEYMCLMLALASALEGSGNQPTFSEAAKHYPFFQNEEIFSSIVDGRPLTYLLDSDKSCGLSSHFKIKNIVLNFIIESELSAPGIYLNTYSNDFPLIYNDSCERAVSFISSHSLSCIFIEGKPGDGRRVLANQICTAIEKNTVTVYSEDIENITEFSEQLTGLCVITDSIPLILADVEMKNAVRLINLLTDFLPIVFICSNIKDVQITLHNRECINLKTESLNAIKRKFLWDYYLDSSTVETGMLADRYRLNAGQIAGICRNCDLNGKTDSEALISEIMSLNSKNSLSEIIHPMFKMEDLIADEHIITVLNQIIKTAKSLSGLFNKYGLNKLFPYGRGLGVLFYGAPGTGKTMSAYILAAELGLDVMKVDLSRIEDKYIGETEKRISEIFEKAGENNCLLFFDEADSLFAKRTEVTDSHDRHANGQTAHLLQKMEEYDGIVVLATNLSSNIDPAFKRRLHFTLEFFKPDAETRSALWRRFIPENMPQESLDFKFLAETFDLTPAEIKWTVISAAVHADGLPLSMNHIFSALKYEYEKSNLAFPKVSYKNIKL